MRSRIGVAGIGLLAILSVGGCASSGPQPSSQDEMVKNILAGIDTDKIVSPVIGFIIDQKGLMYNLTLEGSKISRINP